MLKKLTIVLGMAVAVAGTTTVSSFVFVPEAQAFTHKSIKKAGKKVGGAAKKAGKAIGRKAKKGGKAFGRGAKRGGKWVGRGARRGGKAVGRTAAKGGRAVGRTAKEYGKMWKEGGKDLGKMGKCIVKRDWNCGGEIGDLPAGTKGNPRPAVRYYRS